MVMTYVSIRATIDFIASLLNEPYHLYGKYSAVLTYSQNHDGLMHVITASFSLVKKYLHHSILAYSFLFSLRFQFFLRNTKIRSGKESNSTAESTVISMAAFWPDFVDDS